MKENIITDRSQFEGGCERFQLYNPVKVSKELKKHFADAISKHFIDMGINRFSMVVYPLKKSYKFQRTKE